MILRMVVVQSDLQWRFDGLRTFWVLVSSEFTRSIFVMGGQSRLTCMGSRLIMVSINTFSCCAKSFAFLGGQMGYFCSLLKKIKSLDTILCAGLLQNVIRYRCNLIYYLNVMFRIFIKKKPSVLSVFLV